MIGLVAILKIKPGLETKVSQICRQMAEEVNKKEEGCLFYEAYVSQDNPSEIYFLEKYQTTEDLEEHRKTNHYIAFREKISDKLIDLPAVTVLDPI